MIDFLRFELGSKPRARNSDYNTEQETQMIIEIMMKVAIMG